MTLTAWEAAARMFEPPGPPRWASPLDLACALDPRYVRTPALELVNEALVWADDTPDARLIVTLSPQEGKGLDVETPIATPTGWTTMGDLRDGDEVFGGDGRVCRVTHAYPERRLDCYRVTWHGGASLVADGDHRWLVKDRNGTDAAVQRATGKKARPWVVVTTRDIAARPRQYSVPPSPVLDLPDRDDLIIPPYVLGCWLGDGHTGGPGFTTADDPEITDQLAMEGWPVRKTPGGGPYHWTWAGRRRTGEPTGEFIGALRELGVLGNKHIPIEYLRAGEKQRLALLQGLMDTDGSCYFTSSPYSVCEFGASNHLLAREVASLIRSLGIRCSMTEHRAKLNGNDVGPTWKVKFTTDVPVFRLSRLTSRLYDTPGPRKVRDCIGVKSIERVDTVPTRCIEVDSADHTFLAGHDLVVTHNSLLVSQYGVLWSLLRNPRKRIALASYGDALARRWGRSVRNLVRDHGAGADNDLGLRLAPDLQAANEWALTTGGGMITAGVHTGLTGRPVDDGRVDDPFKDRDEADSPTVRENVWDFHTGTLIPRLAPGAPLMVVATRWSHDDLTGRLLTRYPGRWRHVHIPAQADPEIVDPDPLGRQPGEYMISARGRTDGDWERRKEEMGPDWGPLAQGAPVEPGGEMFDVSRMRYWSWSRDRTAIVCGDRSWRLREDCWIIVTVDLAYSTKRSADWTVASCWAVPVDGSMVLLDVRRARVPEHQQIEVAQPLVDRWNPEASYIESNMKGTQLVREATQAGWVVRDFVPERDKVTRAAAAARRLFDRRMWWPSEPTGLLADAALLDYCKNELQQFPNAKNDDFVDTASSCALVVRSDFIPPRDVAPPSSEPARPDVARAATSVAPNFDPMRADW